MRIDEKISLYLNERAAPGGIDIEKYLKPLYSKSPKVVEKTLKDSWLELAKTLKSNQLEQDAIDIINKHFKTNYSSLDQISKGKVADLPTQNVYEDIKHFWELVKTETFPTLAFWPALQVWLEIDKLLAATGDFNSTKVGVYALFWAALVSGKFVTGWKKWKKEKPEEFKKEGSKKNPFSINKDYGNFEFKE